MARGEEHTFGPLLRRHRLAAGLSQEQLAERAGLTAQAVSALERGFRRTPYRDTVRALARALDLPPPEAAALEASVARGRPDPALPADPPLPALPLPPSSLIGRAREVAEVIDLLHRGPGERNVRLLTLVGPGGVGKTRLALEVAHAAGERYADGAVFVPLASLRDPAHVAAAIAGALQVPESAGHKLPDALRLYLRARHLLLLLDNCEHVLAAAPLVVDLLAACAGLRVLATSRTRLRVSGEHLYLVPPLRTPDPVHLPALADLAGVPAVALLVRRARAVTPDFALDAANAPAVAALCRNLDGLPLALELAAPRLVVLPPELLVQRLASRLSLLTGGARDLPERHQTLRATIGWSYALLGADEQVLFRRLAVFAGGCTLDAVTAVCRTDGSLEDDVLASLGALADQSLVRVDPAAADGPRVMMLETIRDYALEQLEASGEAEDLRRRHAAYYVDLAETAHRTRVTGEGPWLSRLEAELGNLRAVLAWSLEAGATEAGARLLSALGWFWYWRGHADEGRRWAEDLLRRGAGIVAATRARLLCTAADLAVVQGDYGRATVLSAEALSVYHDLGDRSGIAAALRALAGVARMQRDHNRASELYREALALCRNLGDADGTASVLCSLGNVARARGDVGQALALFEEALALYRGLGDADGMAMTLDAMGFLAWLQADHDRATALCTEALALYRTLAQDAGSANALKTLAGAALARGDLARACALAGEALDLYREIGDQEGIPAALTALADVARARGDARGAAELLAEALVRYRWLKDRLSIAECLERLARVAVMGGQPEHAAHLCGAAAALRAALGAPVPPVEHALVDGTRASARAALGSDACAAAEARGRALPLDQIIAAACNHAGRAAARPTREEDGEPISYSSLAGAAGDAGIGGTARSAGREREPARSVPGLDEP